MLARLKYEANGNYVILKGKFHSSLCGDAKAFIPLDYPILCGSMLTPVQFIPISKDVYNKDGDFLAERLIKINLDCFDEENPTIGFC